MTDHVLIKGKVHRGMAGLTLEKEDPTVGEHGSSICFGLFDNGERPWYIEKKAFEALCAQVSFHKYPRDEWKIHAELIVRVVQEANERGNDLKKEV